MKKATNHFKNRDKSASLTVRVKLLSELNSTFAGRPFHTLTMRSLKNVDLTRGEQLFLYNLKECPLVLVQGAHWKKSDVVKSTIPQIIL